MFNGLIWITKHNEKPDAPSVTLAIQTLRNTIFVAIFTGGAVFQYGATNLNNFDRSASVERKVRVVILGAVLLLSFLCWASVIRTSSHLGYFLGALEFHDKEIKRIAAERSAREAETGLISNDINSAIGQLDGSTNEALVECRSLLTIMLISFSFGFRFMFMAIPFGFYAAGPTALVISSFVMILFIYAIDHLELKVGPPDSSATYYASGTIVEAQKKA
jgi:uncharacterized membrane protein